MLPPMMPFLTDVFWLGLVAGLALLAWKATRANPHLFGLDRRWPFARIAAPGATPPWFTTTTARSSGNTAFDAWRNGELARIEAQRLALETRLAAFEVFVDKLKRAKDRRTFERFMAEQGEIAGLGPAEVVAPEAQHQA